MRKMLQNVFQNRTLKVDFSWVGWNLLKELGSEASLIFKLF